MFYLMPTRRRTVGITKVVLSFLAILVLFIVRTHRVLPKWPSRLSMTKYSKFVKQLEAGQTNINYTEFRQSFLESEQFRVAGKQEPDLSALRKTMHELMKKSKYTEIIDATKKMLSIDYTDMEAHKILQQTYKILGDTANRNKYHDIEFGLLNS